MLSQLQNARTTILGYLALISSVVALLTKLLTTGGFDASDLDAVATALAGIGLVLAKDA